ncbi:hypothetical protein LCGC14_1089100 [marine sediment metagenome]|uniref:Uncharacterized protein n=1 Tax=marine sediment metagenome TaxID=412755 RepID=A0A0F9PW52_9ZZZZ
MTPCVNCGKKTRSTTEGIGPQCDRCFAKMVEWVGQLWQGKER